MNLEDKPLRERGSKLRIALWACELAGLAAAYLAWTQGRQTWLSAAMMFGLAFVSTLVGWATAKTRQFRRWDTDRQGKSAHRYEQWSLMSHWTWDSLSAALIAVGGTLLILGFI